MFAVKIIRRRPLADLTAGSVSTSISKPLQRREDAESMMDKVSVSPFLYAELWSGDVDENETWVDGEKLATKAFGSR